MPHPHATPPWSRLGSELVELLETYSDEHVAGKTIPTPGAPEDAKGFVYDNASGAMVWTALATSAALTSETSARTTADSTLTSAAAAAQATANAALPKAGGTMTGKIVLDGDPTADLHATPRQYVLAQINALINAAPGTLDTLGEIATQLASDESAAAALTTTVAGKEATANKNVANGYAGLGSDGLVPSGRIPPENSIERFGGIGDGNAANAATNDAAIAAAYAAGFNVYIPRDKNFVISDTGIFDRDDFVIYGDGPSSKLTLKAGSSIDTWKAMLRFNTSSTPDLRKACGARFLTLDMQGGDQSYTSGGLPGAVVFAYVQDPVCDHLRILNARDKGVEMLGCPGGSIEHCIGDTLYWQGAANFFEIRGSSTLESAENAINDCRFQSSTTVAITSASITSGTTATYVTSAAHKMKAGQNIKVTGCSDNAYNGFWIIASAPTTTTFTVALGSSPGAATGGTLKPLADRAIYLGSLNAKLCQAMQNRVRDCFVGVSAEVTTPGAFDLDISHNLVDDFVQAGVGIIDSSGSTTTTYGHRGGCDHNTIRGVDGTTEFGRASSGSINGVQLNGEWLSGDHNRIYNVREGMVLGIDTNIAEQNLSAAHNKIWLAADANGSGIKVTKNVSTGALDYVTLAFNEVDGKDSTTSRNGIRIIGRVRHGEIVGGFIRGMGQSGVIFEAGSSASPSNWRVLGIKSTENSNASTGTYFGFKVDSGCDDISFGQGTEAHDTRGTPKQDYGLRVESTATNVRSNNADWTNNRTGEISDATTAKISVQDYRDPLGYGIPFTVWPNAITTTAAWSANGRVVYARCMGGGSVSKISVYVGTVDSATPGTTDQIAVAVYSPSGTPRAVVPGTRKAVSASTTAVASSENQVSLGATIRVHEGDIIALGVASTVTTIQQQNGSVAASAVNPGFLAAETPSPTTVPPSTPSVTNGTSLKVPVLIGIP